MIATRAVYCSLRGIREDIFFKGGLADFFSDGGFFWERLARGFVFDELDGLEEAAATNLAYVGMRFEGGERCAKHLTSGRDSIEEFLGFQIIENRIASGGRDGMRLVSEAVHEGGGAFFEGLDDAGRDEDCAERRVTAGDSLSGEDDIGLEAPVLAGERFPGAAHAGHDFVGDQENTVAAADFGDAGGIAVNSGSGAEGCADYRLEDEGSDGGIVVIAEKNVEVVGAG